MFSLFLMLCKSDYKKINICIIVCAAALFFHKLFSSCGERGLSLVAVLGLLIAVASLVVRNWL